MPRYRNILSAPAALVHSLRQSGVRQTAEFARQALCSRREYCVGVAYFKKPLLTHLPNPKDVGGIILRSLREDDIEEVARQLPWELDPRHMRYRCETLREWMPWCCVATIERRIVGASCWVNDLSGEEPWFAIAAPHLRPPALRSAFVFVLSQKENRQIALMLCDYMRVLFYLRGSRSVVNLIPPDNYPSLLLQDRLKGKIVGRIVTRFFMGQRTDETVTIDAQVPVHD